MKTLFFDLDNTLYDRSVPFLRAFSDFFGGRYPDETAKLAHTRCNECGNEVFADSQSGKISMRDMYIYRFQEGMRRAGIGISADDALRFQEIYKSRQHMIGLTDAAARLLDLAKARFGRLAVLTNGPGEHQRGKCARLGLEKWIPPELWFVSGELGVIKPDVQIFRLCEKKTGAAPNDAWMIGDSYETDMSGAIAAGWHTVWLDPAGDPAPDGAKKPEYIVRNLEEAAALIRELPL